MKKHTFKEWVIAVRPWSFPASAMPIIVTLAYLFWTGAEMNWLLGLWALVGMVLFHCTGNVWSDYFDFRKKVDAEDTFGAKTLTTGMFKPEEIRNLAIGFLVVSVACGLGLLAVTGLPLLWIGLAGVACTLLYPVLKYNALGDFDIVMAFAFLPTLGTSYVATGAIDWNVLFVALPVGLITDGILHSNNSRDVVTDRRAGIVTMAMSMGAEKSVWLFGFEMLFPYVWVAALSIAGLLPVYTVFIFLTLPVAIGNARTMAKSLKAGVEMIADLDVKTANLQLMFSVLLTAALVAAKFI
jgi:1,4-dihydroxy-2-naphthoate octaprenyltransferase